MKPYNYAARKHADSFVMRFIAFLLGLFKTLSDLFPLFNSDKHLALCFPSAKSPYSIISGDYPTRIKLTGKIFEFKQGAFCDWRLKFG